MGFLHFTGALLKKYGAVLGERLAKAQECQSFLVELHHLFRKHSMRMPSCDADRLCFAGNAVVRLFRELGIHQVPKLHTIAHFGDFGYHRGPPALWACWVDEGLNQPLKRISGVAHSAVWHERVLDTLGQFLHRLAWENRGTKRSRISS